MSPIYSSAPRCRHHFCVEVCELGDEIEELSFFASHHAAAYFDRFLNKTKKHDSALSGHGWTLELWRGNEFRFQEQLRMSKETMGTLLQYLQNNCGLEALGKVDIAESVFIFLKFVGSALSYYDVEGRFQHSGETIHKHFHHVLKSMCVLGDLIIQPDANTFTDVPEHIRNDSRYYPYFDGCGGAIDGTHVNLRIADGSSTNQWIDRRGNHSTNVLVICDFDMCFTFVDVGKEGSMHDSRILMEAMRSSRRPFPFPPMGKYYLGDSGFPQMTGLLTPYRGVRYHLAEFRDVGVIRNREENFNYFHSSLRSVIERSFGVLKARFKIFNSMLRLRKKTQIETIWACFALHNFIRRYAADEFFTFSERVAHAGNFHVPNAENEDNPLRDDPNDRGAYTANYICDMIKDMLPFH